MICALWRNDIPKHSSRYSNNEYLVSLQQFKLFLFYLKNANNKKIFSTDQLTKKGEFGRIIFCRSHHLYFTISKESKTRKKNKLFKKTFNKQPFSLTSFEGI